MRHILHGHITYTQTWYINIHETYLFLINASQNINRSFVGFYTNLPREHAWNKQHTFSRENGANLHAPSLEWYYCAHISMHRQLCMHACMFVCMYVCMICMYVCIFCRIIPLRTYMYAHTAIQALYVCMYIYIYVYMYLCMYVCVYVCMYVCMYVYTYVCMYASALSTILIRTFDY